MSTLRTSGSNRGPASLALRFALTLALPVALQAGCGRSSEDKTPDDQDVGGGGDDGGDEGTDPSGDTGGSDGGSDGGADGGADGGTDGGTDGGSTDGGDGEPDADTDVDADTDTDTEPAPVVVDVSGMDCLDTLEFIAQIYDVDGVRCDPLCAPGDLQLTAVVANPCDYDQELSTHADVLVSSMSLSNLSTGEGMGMSVGSSGGPTDWPVPAGTGLAEPTYFGYLEGGEYQLDIGFDDVDRHSATLLFTVE